MSTTNPTYGLQLDATTLVLYKSIGEIGNGAPTDNLTFTDEVGDYNWFEFSGTVGFEPPIVNGPLGAAGALQDSPQFARGFKFWEPNVGGRPQAGRIQTDADIDQAFNDALRLAPFTQQVMFWYDYSGDNRDCQIMGGQVSPTSSSTGEDRLAHLYVDVSAGETIVAHFESANLDTFVTLTGLVPELGKWHVLTVVWDPSGSGYAIDAWLHKLDGTVQEIANFSVGDTGTKPIAGSGLTAAYAVGAVTAGTTVGYLQGALAFARIKKTSMTGVQALADATELLTTGTLAEGTGDDLFRLEFNDPPAFIDEGPLGMHGQDVGWVYDYTAGGAAGTRHIDLVGSGGRARFVNSDYSWVPNTTQPSLLNQLIPGYTKLESVFNNDVATVPGYTIQQVGVWGPGTGNVLLLQWEGSDNPSWAHTIFRLSINMATGTATWYSESGSNVGVTISNLVVAGLQDLDITQQTMLVTLRFGEKPGFPGTARFRVSINDQLDIMSGDLDAVPEDGRHGQGIEHHWPEGGMYQEFKVSFAEISDDQILADWERMSDREGPCTTETPSLGALSIEQVEILSANTLLLTFSEPLSQSEVNYLAESYSIMELNVRSVMPPIDDVSPQEVVLVTDEMQVGIAYHLTANGLVPASGGTFDQTTLPFTGRTTKLDKALGSTPLLYDTDPDSTMRQLMTAIHREDDRIGGSEE